MSGWLDGWTRVDNNPRSSGGTYDPENEGYPWRIVLHTIEGRGFPNLSAHQYPPQLWYNPITRQKAQTIPLDRSAFALYQASDAPYYTNRARALQVEMVGFAEEAGVWPDGYLRNIAQDVIVPLVEWVQSQGGTIDLSDPAVPLPGAIPNSAREDAPQRLAPKVWAFGPIGLCSHRHVPMGDDHWDTGALDTRKIARYATELLGGSFSVAGFTQELFTVGQYEDLMKAVTATQQMVGTVDQHAEGRWQYSEGTANNRTAAVQKTLGDNQAALAGSLNLVHSKLDAVVDKVAAAILSRLPTATAGGGTQPAVDPDVLRTIVRDELGALILVTHATGSAQPAA